MVLLCAVQRRAEQSRAEQQSDPAVGIVIDFHALHLSYQQQQAKQQRHSCRGRRREERRREMVRCDAMRCENAANERFNCGTVRYNAAVRMERCDVSNEQERERNMRQRASTHEHAHTADTLVATRRQRTNEFDRCSSTFDGVTTILVSYHKIVRTVTFVGMSFSVHLSYLLRSHSQK